jgi:hypothetical protein
MSAGDVIADHAHWLGAFDDAGRERDAIMILTALRAAGYVVVKDSGAREETKGDGMIATIHRAYDKGYNDCRAALSQPEAKE